MALLACAVPCSPEGSFYTGTDNKTLVVSNKTEKEWKTENETLFRFQFSILFQFCHSSSNYHQVCQNFAGELWTACQDTSYWYDAGSQSCVLFNQKFKNQQELIQLGFGYQMTSLDIGCFNDARSLAPSFAILLASLSMKWLISL